MEKCDKILEVAYNEIEKTYNINFESFMKEVFKLSDSKLRNRKSVKKSDFSADIYYESFTGLFDKSDDEESTSEKLIKQKREYEKTSKISSSIEYYLKSRIVNVEAYAKWLECKKLVFEQKEGDDTLEKYGIKARITGDSADEFEFRIDRVPKPGINEKYVKISKSSWSSNLEIIGTNDLEKGDRIELYTGIQQKFKRNNKKKGYISVTISDFGNIYYEILEVKENYYTILPLGTIISSMLTEEQLLKTTQEGDDTWSVKNSKWALCDKRSLIGSEYWTLTNETEAPDLRGVFLRGKQHDRNDGKGHPSKNIKLGDYEGDSLRNHTHNINTVSAGVDGGGTYYNTVSGNKVKGPNIENDKSETRPKNVTINYFIRIN